MTYLPQTLAGQGRLGVRWLERSWFGWGRALACLYAGLFLDLNVRYHTPIPPGPKILAANHPSTSDPILLTFLVPEQVSVLITETLFQVPMVGASLRLAGHIRVDKGRGATALAEAVYSLKAGRTIGIFPEGEISPPGGGFGAPRTGLARLALCTGVPVIPIGIALDPNRIHRISTRVAGRPEVGTWYLRGPYAVTVGTPAVYHGDVEDRARVRSVAAGLMAQIAALAHESAGRLPAPPLRQWGLFRRLLSWVGI